MEVVIGVLAGTVAVLVLVIVINAFARRRPQQVIEDTARTELQIMSQAALAQSSEQFLKLAEERFQRQSQAGDRELDTKKQLIDQQLQGIKAELQRVETVVQRYEKDREAKFSVLSTDLKKMGEQTAALTASTSKLNEVLSSSQARGQWGERMAEDILRLIGFVEGVNYRKQVTLDGGGSRPDFEFLLPGELRMNMDVKFPLDNFVKFLDVDSDVERDRYRAAFIRDVRGRIKEVTSREYIDPDGGTVDYVLLFIPNESVYSFIHETDSGVLDTALQSRVVLCSPLTLYAVLCVVRQAVDNFALQRDSEEIISLLGAFNAQWAKFTDSFETVGKRLSSAQGAYDDTMGPRRRALERALSRIEALRLQRGIEIAESGEAALDASDGDQAGSAAESENVSDSSEK